VCNVAFKGRDDHQKKQPRNGGKLYPTAQLLIKCLEFQPLEENITKTYAMKLSVGFYSILEDIICKNTKENCVQRPKRVVSKIVACSLVYFTNPSEPKRILNAHHSTEEGKMG
jgi:hypothetical protein